MMNAREEEERERKGLSLYNGSKYKGSCCTEAHASELSPRPCWIPWGSSYDEGKVPQVRRLEIWIGVLPQHCDLGKVFLLLHEP